MTDRLVDEFSKIPTTSASDALKGHTTMDYRIKPLTSQKVAGRAFTVKITKGQNKDFLKALKEANENDVIVVDAEGDTRRAIAGDFVVGMARTLGIQGIIVDGVIRDIEGIQALDYPVFAIGTTCDAGFKAAPGILNRPISCGGVSVKDGDIVLGDADGVVVVPKEEAETVLEKAKQKIEKDEARDERVGNSIEEIHRYIDSMTS
ncbi:MULTISPECIES: RraA family protein [Salinicoccus]|uniref:Putative 4-hydroxy-4-methyl-2-oxoglutarate aldolase n=1 Tax=Salinicoccus roseus TaxID=45670 RepID=A0A265E7A6_9STAP|nr:MULTISPECIES: RraA family protein [Salinicoccus]OZT77479.1 regulator [Salinicoccus roseus]